MEKGTSIINPQSSTMSLKEDPSPSWMDKDNDENHNLMFGSGKSSLQDEESLGGKDSRSNSGKGADYGATNDADEGGKSVISTITAEEQTTNTVGSTLEGPQRNLVLNMFYVSCCDSRCRISLSWFL